MKLIGVGLSGKMYSGKTTLAKRIEEEYGSKRLSIADEVKAVATSLFGMKPQQKDRKLLQAIGQTMRTVREDVWIDVLLRNIDYVQSYLKPQIGKIKGNYPIFVVDDVRYPNEKRKMEANGFLIVRLNVSLGKQLERARYRDHLATLKNKEIAHESEVALNRSRFKHEIDSDRDIEPVWDDLKRLIDEEFKIRRSQGEGKIPPKAETKRALVGVPKASKGSTGFNNLQR